MERGAGRGRELRVNKMGERKMRVDSRGEEKQWEERRERVVREGEGEEDASSFGFLVERREWPASEERRIPGDIGSENVNMFRLLSCL